MNPTFQRVTLLLLLVLGAAPPAAQATFSLCAIDPATGEAGVIVTTRVPFVGRAVPWARAGVGAVATQAWTVVEYGRQGLDLLAQGMAPQEAIERLLADDKARERRQLGMIDMQGRAAAYTGKENGEWAGSRQGRHYTVQGNILVGREVIDAVADHFESTEGTGMPLAERLILALAAGQAKGGDRRWGLFQSAALRVADPNDPGRGGDHLSVSIDVGEHEDPIGELRRIYWTTQRRLGYRVFSEIQGRDVVELKRMLHALGYWRKDLPVFPQEPVVRADPSLQRTDPERYQKQLDERRQAFDTYMKEFALYDAAVMDAVDAFRKDHGLVFEGNPRGLVDERFVQALREAYQAKKREPPGEAMKKPRGGSGGRLLAAAAFAADEAVASTARQTVWSVVRGQGAGGSELDPHAGQEARDRASRGGVAEAAPRNHDADGAVGAEVARRIGRGTRGVGHHDRARLGAVSHGRSSSPAHGNPGRGPAGRRRGTQQRGGTSPSLP